MREKLELGYRDAKNIYGKQLLELLKEFEGTNLDSEKSGIEKILRIYIYELKSCMEEEVYSREDFSGHEKMIEDFISKSPYKIKLEDVIAFHSGRMIGFTEEGFLFANADVCNFVFYKEISRVNRNSRSGKWLGGSVSFYENPNTQRNQMQLRSTETTLRTCCSIKRRRTRSLCFPSNQGSFLISIPTCSVSSCRKQRNLLRNKRILQQIQSR